MSASSSFDEECRANAAAMAASEEIRARALELLVKTAPHKYSYNFRWLGRPVIQFPEDLVAMQELLWEVRPDLVIETGVAHGGSLVFYASMLELHGGAGRVLGIDIDIRAHNRAAIEAHPMAKRISLLQGSSVDEAIAAQVREAAQGKRVLLALDSNHTHDHVLRELQLYAPLVAVGSYAVVFDTVVQDMPEGSFPDRPWGRGNNPKTAVHAFLREDDRFQVDREIENKLLLTVAPDGYLKRVK